MLQRTLRLGLALSGGGLRATLYHLGMVRFLKDSDLLSSVSHITSVSGGSVLAAHLVLNWDRYNGSPEDFDAAAQEVIDFVRLDVRNRIVRRYPFALAGSCCHRLAWQRPPRQWTRTGLLEQHYRDFLFGDTCLYQLPDSPELHLLATNLSEGGLSSFTRTGLHIETRTKLGGLQMRRHRGGLATVPMAVAASSAFPGFFPPLELTAEDIGANAGDFQTQYFTDGGVYDNLGVRMFRHLELKQQSSLSPEDSGRLESAVRIWNRAAESESRSPLRRLVEIYAGGDPNHDSGSSRRSPLVSESTDLLAGLELLISQANLDEDPQLQALLPANELPADESGTSPGGSGGSDPSAFDSSRLPNSVDQVSRNRELINRAFRNAIGEDLLSAPSGGFDAIIASDAGKKFQVTRPDRSASFLRTAMRSSDILMDRVWQLEKEHFGNSADFVFVPITRVVEVDEDPTALEPEIQVQVSRMRTDMDRFADHEIIGLVRHGYAVARQTLATRSCLSSFIHDGPPWDPITNSTKTKSANATRPSWRRRHAVETTRHARQLQRSARRQYLGVMLSPRDWVTYLYIPLLVLILGVVPYSAYRVWRHSQVSSLLTSAIAETRHDYKTLLDLMENGTVTPWEGMKVVDVDQLDALFAEKGLDIVSDTRITDLRNLDYSGGFVGTDRRQFVYMYRFVSVRKMEHTEGATGLRLQWDVPAMRVRCQNAALSPEVRRRPTGTNAEGDIEHVWQVNLDFRSVPVGHMVDVVVEALLPVELADENDVRNWGRFEVDADPEVVTSWLLLPASHSNHQPALIRSSNETPEMVELVEPTYDSSILNGAIRSWTVVHPKAGYTYNFHWGSDL